MGGSGHGKFCVKRISAHNLYYKEEVKKVTASKTTLICIAPSIYSLLGFERNWTFIFLSCVYANRCIAGTGQTSMLLMINISITLFFLLLI